MTTDLRTGSAEAGLAATAAAFPGGGVAGELIRSIDWARTPLGPVVAWSVSLRTMVRMVILSRHPMFLWWGPEHVQFYNDAYLPSFDVGMSLAAMGQRGADCWQELWPVMLPQIDAVMKGATPTWHEDELAPMFRNGHLEDVYWSYGYTPIFDEAGVVGGTLVTCTETTPRVLAERRLRTLNALAEGLVAAHDFDGLARAVEEALEGAEADVPVAALVRIDPLTHLTTLGVSVRLRPEAWRVIEPAVRSAARAASTRVSLPQVPGVTPVAEVFVARVSVSSALVFGIDARLRFDDAYREHLLRVAERVASAEARVEAQHVRTATERARDNLLMEGPVAMVLLSGPEHRFELANPLFEQIVGRRSLAGQTYAEAFPELRGTALPAVLDRVYRTGEPYVADEYPVALDLRGHGVLEPRYFKFNLAATRDGRGQVNGMMGVAVDITEQVTARQVLEQAHAEREKLLAELSAALRAKDEFLAMLGHELRNPLAPIVTALHLMKVRDDGTTTKEQEVVSRQVGHLVRLVDDLLDVSKITRGKVELRKETLEIAEVAAKATEIAGVLIEQRHHHLTVDVPRTGLRWEGDPVRLAQVLANLLTNAARYTDPGGHIRLAAAAEGDTIVLSVTDDGIGIAAEILPSIFDAFFQGRRSADRAEGGLGLGLTLVKSLVTMHGGTVAAASGGLGQGSTFVVRLPAAPAGAADLEKPTPVPSSVVRASVSRRILVVDDNVDAADLLAALLDEAGHVVAVAYDPLDALETAARFAPDITFLDIGLPIMDGYELGDRLRALPAAAHCRLIALTGYGEARDHARSAQAGFELHLVKPIDAERLVAMCGDPALPRRHPSAAGLDGVRSHPPGATGR